MDCKHSKYKGCKLISYAVLGGIFLNIGAYLTFRGKIYQAVFIYLLADLCWIIMAYERDDFLGMASIAIGVTFGILAFMKMKTGKMKKTIIKEDNE